MQGIIKIPDAFKLCSCRKSAQMFTHHAYNWVYVISNPLQHDIFTIEAILPVQLYFLHALIPTVRRRARTRLTEEEEEEDAETQCNSISICLILSTRLHAYRWTERVKMKCWETLRGREFGVVPLSRAPHHSTGCCLELSVNRLCRAECREKG